MNLDLTLSVGPTPGPAAELLAALRPVADVLDGVHNAGTVVPAVVYEAARTLCAFAGALAHNAAGQPTPEPYRSQLRMDEPQTGTEQSRDVGRRTSPALAGTSEPPAPPDDDELVCAYADPRRCAYGAECAPGCFEAGAPPSEVEARQSSARDELADVEAGATEWHRRETALRAINRYGVDRRTPL